MADQDTDYISDEARAKENAAKDRMAADKARATAIAHTPILQFFEYSHLPPALAAVSEPFCTLAFHMLNVVEAGPERTVMLRKLLEAKDCAVRQALADRKG